MEVYDFLANEGNNWSGECTEHWRHITTYNSYGVGEENKGYILDKGWYVVWQKTELHSGEASEIKIIAKDGHYDLHTKVCENWNRGEVAIELILWFSGDHMLQIKESKEHNTADQVGGDVKSYLQSNLYNLLKEVSQ